jgi:ribosomal protein L35
MSKKSRKRKRNLKKATIVDKTDIKKIARLLPNK